MPSSPQDALHPGASQLVEEVQQMFYMQNLDKQAIQLVWKYPKCQDSKVKTVQPTGRVPMRIE